MVLQTAELMMPKKPIPFLDRELVEVMNCFEVLMSLFVQWKQ